MKLRILLLLFILFSLFDTFFTIQFTNFTYKLNEIESMHERRHSNTFKYFVTKPIGIEELESNPIAKIVLRNCGVLGMVLYKFFIVGIFCTSIYFIAKKYTWLAHTITGFGCIITLFVVIYGCVNNIFVWYFL